MKFRTKITPAVIEEFCYGWCVCLALALHDITRWPISVLTWDIDAWGIFLDHAYVINPDGRPVDIRGVLSVDIPYVNPKKDTDISLIIKTLVTHNEIHRLRFVNNNAYIWALYIIRANPEHFGLTKDYVIDRINQLGLELD